MLGLGLGLHKNKLIRNNAQLVKSAGGVLYLDARKATGTGKTTAVNTPFVDLSGKGNNATLTNFAGTTSSGYDISDPIRPFLRFDGTDDYGALVNTPSIDITSAPLAVFATVRLAADAGSAFIVSSYNTVYQYGLYIDTVNKTVIFYNTISPKTSVVNAIQPAAWYNIGWIWDGANVKFYSQRIALSYAAITGTLTSQGNFRISGRNGSASWPFKGDLATLTIYSGAKATEANILKAEKALSKAYIGG